MVDHSQAQYFSLEVIGLPPLRQRFPSVFNNNIYVCKQNAPRHHSLSSLLVVHILLLSFSLHCFLQRHPFARSISFWWPLTYKYSTSAACYLRSHSFTALTLSIVRCIPLTIFVSMSHFLFHALPYALPFTRPYQIYCAFSTPWYNLSLKYQLIRNNLNAFLEIL